MGSQQRSWKQFARAVELVRNGRIGTLKQVEIGLPGDPAGGNPEPMPVPAGFNYDAWLGSTPEVPYTVDRVMPVKGFDRPGWLRMEQFGAGMITGWGAHHVDTAHWGMDTELTGPVEIWGHAEFPPQGLWNVHGPFKTYGRYANGVVMTISGDFENGIKWIGDKGWIFVCRDGRNDADSIAQRSSGSDCSAARQRPEDSRLRDWLGRVPRLHRGRSAWQLAGLHPFAQGARRAGGTGASRLQHLPAALDCDEGAASYSLESGDGDNRGRRYRCEPPVAPPAASLRDWLMGVAGPKHVFWLTSTDPPEHPTWWVS